MLLDKLLYSLFYMFYKRRSGNASYNGLYGPRTTSVIEQSFAKQHAIYTATVRESGTNPEQQLSKVKKKNEKSEREPCRSFKSINCVGHGSVRSTREWALNY